VTGPHGDTNLLEHLLNPPVRECPTCDGEGYRYVENPGRHSHAAIHEYPCRTCGGTGVRP
jgi:DnaJ-class molecular chaperone